MESGRDSANPRLKLLVPPRVASGVTIDLQSTHTFKVTLHVEKISKCTLVVNSDMHVFKDYSQEIEVEFTSPT